VQVNMRKMAPAVATVLVAALVGACGSSSSNGGGGGGGGSSNGSGSSAVATPTSGAGLTQPTAPAGKRISGGTVYFTQIPQQMPNYIFPLYSPRCATTRTSIS
jgi:hypothetical protein